MIYYIFIFDVYIYRNRIINSIPNNCYESLEQQASYQNIKQNRQFFIFNKMF